MFVSVHAKGVVWPTGGSHHTQTQTRHILLFQRQGWRRPTLPHPPRCSTIGAGRLSFRVRKGTGRDPTALTTNTHHRTTHNTQPNKAVCCTRHQTVDASNQQTIVFRHRIHCCFIRSISTGHLNTSQCLQIRPINPIISGEPQKKPHHETGFPLRCFQRLSLPYVANQPCPRQNNWHTRGTSVPVLSY